MYKLVRPRFFRGRITLPAAIALSVALLSIASCGLDAVTQAGNASEGTTSGTGGGDYGTGGDNSGGAGGESTGTGGDLSGSGGDLSGSGGDLSGSGGANTLDGGSGTGGSAGGPPPPMSGRVDVIINSGWKFNRGDVPGAEQPNFDDGAWVAVNLPHTWNNVDGQDGPLTTPAYWRGIGWYRKRYPIPADMAGKKIYLQFDGSAYITDVWVNGKSVGSHAGGYAAFRFDISSAAMTGQDNVIAIKVNNQEGVNNNNNLVVGSPMANVAPLSGDFTLFGGVYRNLHLLATDPLAISPLDHGSSGVYLRPSNVSATSADLSVTVKLTNGNSAAKTATVEAAILDATGATVQTLTGMQSVPASGAADAVLTGKVTSPHLWNGRADPYLYHVNVVVKDGMTITDAVQQPLGFRSYSIDPNKGFFLNGKSYRLHGVNMHQEHKDKGNDFSPADIDTDFALLSEIGANMIRMAHYQHSAYEYDKADQLGFVVWAENALVNRVNDPPEFAANTNQQLIELIRQNFNHPSIVFWSLSNEILNKGGPSPLPIIQMLNATAKAEDPSRTTVTAANNGKFDDPTNWTATANCFNEYQGWYGGYMKSFATWADTTHAAHPNQLVGVSEYGAGSSIISHQLPIMETGTNRTGGYQTEEYQAVFHETFWQAIETRPFLVLTTVWVMFDFASDYRNEGLAPGINTKGLVTHDRKVKKDAFYWYKANWSEEPVVYIAYRRFTAMPKSATEIKVYSNQPEVELKLNGTSLGKKQSANHIFLWTGVQWAPGMNTAEASATSGQGGTDKVVWTN